MTFPYNEGSATPNFSGLFELPDRDLRICDVATGSPLVDPTFHPLVIPPLVTTAPLRYNVTPIPRGGASVSVPLVDSWQFDVTGWFLMDDPDDVQAAFDYLCDAVCIAMGQQEAQLNAVGWTEARTMTVQKAGQVAYGQNPDKGEMAAGYREFVLPFIAADPIKYSLTEHSTVIGTGTTVTNSGNAKVPYIARFDGPNTGHVQIDATGGGTLLFNYALGSGEYVEIFTKDGSYVTNVGVDLYPYISVDAACRLLSPGGNGFTKSSGGGTPVATVKHYDGWE